MKKRIFALMLAALMLISMLAACGGGNGGSTTDATTTDSPDVGGTTAAPDTTAPVIEVPKEEYIPSGNTYDGATFTVLLSSKAPENELFNDFKYNEENATVLDDAVYRKNSQIEDEYDIVFNYITNCGGSNTAKADITNQLTVQDETYHLYMVPAYDTISLAYENSLYDLNSVPGLDTSLSYWDQNANSQLSINDLLFFTTGDISVWDDRQQFVVMFNKNLFASEAGADDNIYDIVEEGKWTYDLLAKYSENCADDVDGDDDMDLDDKYGILLWDDTVYGALASAGERMVSLDKNDDLILTIYNERALDVLDKFTAIEKADYTVNYQRTTYDGSPAKKMFEESRAMFFLGRLSSFDNFRDMEIPFGVLPYPKFEESQESYHSTVSYYHTSFYCMPNLDFNIEMRGDITNACAYYSQQYMTPAYIERTLVGTHIRDEESEMSLKILIDNRLYDIGYCVLTGKPGMTNSLIQGFRDEVDSYVARFDQVKRVTERQLNSINGHFDTVILDWQKD